MLAGRFRRRVLVAGAAQVLHGGFRSFFLDDSQRAHDVVESIVELARKLGIETVAEGIEAPEQVDFLRSIGCDLVQGYVYARPMPAEELEAWMRARHGGEVTQI